MKVQIVLLCLAAAAAAAEQNVYCGRRLAMAMALMCGYDGEEKRGGDALWAWSRARGPGAIAPWLEAPPSPNAVAPWLAPHKARTVSRGKRQIVMECCMKPCSENELIAYC